MNHALGECVWVAQPCLLVAGAVRLRVSPSATRVAPVNRRAVCSDTEVLSEVQEEAQQTESRHHI